MARRSFSSVGLEALRSLDERLELCEALSDSVGVASELVVAPAGREELSPGCGGVPSSSKLLGTDERVERLELERWTGKAALLELPGHRDQALGRSCKVLARHRAPPCVGARAAIAKDAPGEYEASLAFGPELCEAGNILVVEEPVRHVELGLDVRLAARGSDRRTVGASAEKETDRLGEDRLPRTCLAGHRVQPRGEVEVRIADEDEVLDAEPTKHAGNSPRLRLAPCLSES